MTTSFLIFLRKKILTPKTKQFLKQLGLYNYIKNLYRAFIFFVGKNGLRLKIKDTSAKIIVSNSNEMDFYYSIGNEKDFLQRLLTKINSQTVFYDIGAHIGLYSLAVAKYKITPKFIYCWEPEPYNFKRLKENIKLNNTNIIRAFPVALGSENTIKEMTTEIGELSSPTHSLVKASSESTLLQSVQVVKGDMWVSEKKLYLPSVIKIDVEGYEFNVIKGFKETIKKSRPIIFLEIHPILLENLGVNKEQILNFLRKIRYEVTYSSLRRREEHYIVEHRKG